MGDGRKRGLLFIALNSRIDLQFELIQSRWINTDGFLGQAGLNRCPIVGANKGKSSDAFLEAGAIAPVVNLPRFVVTRGGDYFFAPGVEVLRRIADGETFPPDGEGVPFDGYSMAGAYTPSLFDPLLDPSRVKAYGEKILGGAHSVIRIEMPPPSASPVDPASGPVALVGQHADVAKVLSLVPSGQPVTYSTVPYRTAGQRITRGHNLLEGTEPGTPPSGGSTQDEYKLLRGILDEAWCTLNQPPGSVYGRLKGEFKGALDVALKRVETSGAVDLVTDLALPSVYEVIAKVFGVPGPNWLTELAVALPFCRQHFGELPPDWLKTIRTPPPPIPGLATLQVWSIAIVFDLVANYGQLQELMAISDQAAGEFLEYLDMLLTTTRANALARPGRQPSTLVGAFVANEGKFVGSGLPYGSPQQYYLDVATLLLDLVASAVAFIPNVFGYVMDAIFDFGLNLHDLIPVLTTAPQYGEGSVKDGLPRLIYETCRVSPRPPASILMRTCLQDDTLPSGGVVKEGDFVAAMVAAAGMDPRTFANPTQFSLFPFLPGPPRNLDDYLLFGVAGTGRYCWGRDKLALLALSECLKAAGRLQNLRRAAGQAGVLQTNLGTNIGIATGLHGRFDAVFPDWPPQVSGTSP